MLSVARITHWSRVVLPELVFGPRKTNPIQAVCALFEVSHQEAASLISELETDARLKSALDKGLTQRRRTKLIWKPWHPFVYCAVRLLRPNTVIETGVFDGRGSAIILSALDRNRNGTLISIDLPAENTIIGATDKMFGGQQTTLPPDCTPGWLVPEYLRYRYQLHLGDAKDLLPQLLTGAVDLFLHDSLHTFDHQMFEYRTAWPHIPAGGLLMSDDILWTPAFRKFAKSVKARYVSLGNFAAIRKE